MAPALLNGSGPQTAGGIRHVQADDRGRFGEAVAFQHVAAETLAGGGHGSGGELLGTSDDEPNGSEGVS
jgi:hypothetical protein